MKTKFLQKKQLILIVCTLVVMLCVWFAKSPLSASKDKDGDDIQVNTSVGIFDDLREAVLEQRAIEVASWDAILADESATVSNKQLAVSQKKAISDLTEKEVLLEIEVINMGYEDAFVHSTTNGVEVYVKVEEDSATSAVEIINLVYTHFEDAENVIVNFKTE